MRGEQHDAVLDRLDARQLAALAAVAEHAEVAKRGADAPVVAPVGERLEQLTELVEIRAHLQPRDAGLLIDDAEESACLERQLEQVAHVFAQGCRVELVDVLDTVARSRKVHILEVLDSGVGDQA